MFKLCFCCGAFEEDSLEVLSSFPDEVKRALGFSLRQLQPHADARQSGRCGRGTPGVL
jgi:phage-related protein